MPEPLRALLAFIEKVNRATHEVTPEDVEAARQAGWSDEALYDAITVAALFAFYNTWVDATGVHDLPASSYEMQARRLATTGYVVRTN
jgi:alkylhydroperoxidase family enzyme